MTAIISAQVHGYGKLIYRESTAELAILILKLEGAFDSCAIYDALEALTIAHTTNFDSNPIEVTLTVKVGASVRNPEGFTHMWARKLRETANECHNDYLRSIQIVETQPELVTSSCPHCGFHEVRQFPGGNMKVLDEIGGELFDLHMDISPDCPYFPSWC